MSKWSRPEYLEHPKVYRKWISDDLVNTKTVEYRIQELPRDRFEDGVEFLLKHYCTTEPMLESKEAAKDPEFIEDISNYFRYIFGKEITIACFKKTSDEILGISLMDVIVEGEEEDFQVSSLVCDLSEKLIFYKFQPKSRLFREDHLVMDLVLQKSDHFKRFNVDKYLTCWALAVHSDYWGRGICTELIKAKIDMLKFLDLELTSTGYSADGSIRASEKAGFKCVFEIR